MNGTLAARPSAGELEGVLAAAGLMVYGDDEIECPVVFDDADADAAAPFRRVSCDPPSHVARARLPPCAEVGPVLACSPGSCTRCWAAGS
jgi:hypothetical protein